jgi:hypothetical protein
MMFAQSIRRSENQKLDYDDEVIVSVDTEKILKHDEMNVFCAGCM